MSDQDNNDVTNVIVKDLTFMWAKLNPKRPVNPFGKERWELTVDFPVKRSTEMEQYGTVKDTDDPKIKRLNLIKNAYKKDGSEAAPIQVVDRHGNPVDPRTIGNGSKGNVKLMLRPYQQKGKNGKVIKEGTVVMLTKVQVTDLIKYEPKMRDDFDYDTDEDESENEVQETPVKRVAKKVSPKAKNQVEDEDEIPF